MKRCDMCGEPKRWWSLCPFGWYEVCEDCADTAVENEIERRAVQAEAQAAHVFHSGSGSTVAERLRETGR